MTEGTDVTTTKIAALIAQGEADAGQIVSKVSVERASDELYMARVWYRNVEEPSSFIVPVKREAEPR